MSLPRIKLADMPDWPLLLSRGEAAAFLGCSTRRFEAEVALGIWPPGESCIAQGGALRWHRPTLERLSEMGVTKRTAADWKLIAEAARRAIG